MYIHLSEDLETAQKVDALHGRLVVYLIQSGKMAGDGHKFYLSVNGIWLTEDVPIEYLRKLS